MTPIKDILKAFDKEFPCSCQCRCYPDQCDGRCQKKVKAFLIKVLIAQRTEIADMVKYVLPGISLGHRCSEERRGHVNNCTACGIDDTLRTCQAQIDDLVKKLRGDL